MGILSFDRQFIFTQETKYYMHLKGTNTNGKSPPGYSHDRQRFLSYFVHDSQQEIPEGKTLSASKYY